jgi:hypothetical protein
METRIPEDWTFIPTQRDLDGLNKLRDHHGLPRVENVTRAKQWFDACAEIDAWAEAAECILTPSAGG